MFPSDVDNVIAGPAQQTSVTYDAAPGERNDVTVTTVKDFVMVHDAGAPVTSATGCEALTPDMARCAVTTGPRRFTNVLARLGDGDDRGRLQGDVLPGSEIIAGGVLDGGAGEDLLRSDHDGGLNGAAGADDLAQTGLSGSMTGGSASDTLRGGPGDDRLVGDDAGDTPAPDTLDGGFGRDEVLILSPEDVVLDLTKTGPQGEPGAQDTLVSIEDLTARTNGTASLAGDAGVNRLVVAAGPRARLDGRGGDDVLKSSATVYSDLRGGDGADSLSAMVIGSAGGVLRGGAGRDWLAGPSASQRGAMTTFVGGDGDDVVIGGDRVICGAGRDRVFPPVAGDILERFAPVAMGCEQIALGVIDLIVAPVRSTIGLLLLDPQPAESPFAPDLLVKDDRRQKIRVRVCALDSCRRPLATGAAVFAPPVFAPPAAMARHVLLRRTVAGRRWLRAGRPVRVRVLVDLGAPPGDATALRSGGAYVTELL